MFSCVLQHSRSDKYPIIAHYIYIYIFMQDFLLEEGGGGGGGRFRNKGKG